MVNFKERVVTAAAFLVTLIIIFSSNNNLNRARISLALPIYRPLTGTIDRIARQNGVLPRFWSTAGATSLSHQDAEDVSANVPKIMGLVFFGRRDTVSIIDCYLKNGGILDGVIFVERTTNSFDVAFLEELLLSEPDYKRWKIKRPNQNRRKGDYSSAYDRIENNVMYIKIDDDIVFIEDSTIPSLVDTKASRPDAYVVSANIVNQPLMSWVHWSLGAVASYLPELTREFSFFFSSFDWRPSTLPSWSGSGHDDFNSSRFVPTETERHRWLPLRGKDASLLANQTPIANAKYAARGPGWHSWHMAAQQHHSLLEHLENNDLWRYKFDMWDFQKKRMGIQLVAMTGRDINAAKPIPKDDEFHFGITMPRKLGRLAIADGRGVAAHYSYLTQLKTRRSGGLSSTDILDRYRMFARESICENPMLWASHNDDAELLEKYGSQYLQQSL